MICVSEALSPGQGSRNTVFHWWPLQPLCQHQRRWADRRIRFGNSRLIKDFAQSARPRRNFQPSGGEKDEPQLSVVGLTSPIFAKVGSISCRTVHENGNDRRLISDYEKRSAVDSEEKGMRYRTASRNEREIKSGLSGIASLSRYPDSSGFCAIPFPRRAHRQLD